MRRCFETLRSYLGYKRELRSSYIRRESPSQDQSEFSLMVTPLRIVQSGLLDQTASLEDEVEQPRPQLDLNLADLEIEKSQISNIEEVVRSGLGESYRVNQMS